MYLDILAYPWFSHDDMEIVQWKYPFTSDQQIKYKIYKDLWEKGYYISSGEKFGGDFLVYPGVLSSFYNNDETICTILIINIYIIYR